MTEQELAMAIYEQVYGPDQDMPSFEVARKEEWGGYCRCVAAARAVLEIVGKEG